jgi:hypothetical protein
VEPASSIQNRRIAVGLIALVTLISGCATGLSKEECQTADWHTIGYEDGVRGLSESRITTHRKACAKHGVTLMLNAYRGGWDKGIARYCQPGNGYQQGRSGRQYSGICPETLESDFLQAYRDGRSRYELETDIQRTTKKIVYKRNRLDTIDAAVRDAGIEMIAKDTASERRIILLDEIRKLTDERSELKTQIPLLEAKLKKQKKHLVRMSSSSIY